MSAGLYSTKLGEQGSWVVFCHGLFGQGKNWTQIAKVVAQRHRVLLLDMPQHGRSAWSPHFDYLDAADQVAAAISEAAGGESVALVGHSMGGKIAMALALRHPEQVERLCVVDVAPVAYASGREFVGYVHAMRGLDLAVLATRADADAALADAVPNPVVRGFLLQNLRRSPDGQGWAWQPNLEVIEDDLDVITGWPARPSRRPPAVRRPGAVGARPTVRARRRRARRGHVGAVPEAAAGDDQGRRALGALRAARVVPRGPPAVLG